MGSINFNDKSIFTLTAGTDEFDAGVGVGQTSVRLWFVSTLIAEWLTIDMMDIDRFTLIA